MKGKEEQGIELAEAQDAILNACAVLPEETIALADGLGRVASTGHTALEPLPGYDGSLRDGFAIGDVSRTPEATTSVYRVVGEVAAGDTRSLTLNRGEAVRIMTGGLVPTGCRAVIPQESCQVDGEYVTIPPTELAGTQSFIHKAGSEIAAGSTILEHGQPLSSEHQILLAGVGYTDVRVARKPKVSFFCTGSELLNATGTEIKKGQRFSGNSPLLSGLIAKHGGALQEQMTVADDLDQVVAQMERLSLEQNDIVISTGGMGPGKFDLIERAFAKCGGEVIYSALHMRPGKSTLFGKLGRCLFFGLPGPPPAVHLLFHELVRPALCALQGASQCVPQKIKAELTEEMILGRRGLLRLKSGVLSLDGGRCFVRTAARQEVANCYIFCLPDKTVLEQGNLVDIHLTANCLS